ncbi:MAG TPA: hypothetical protein VF230_16150, partial [Acidimicrobiales bacterium]
MNLNIRRAVVLLLGASLLGGLSTPASASGSGTISDGPGQDFDPSEISVAGQHVTTLNDGSSTSTDILSASLDAVTVGGQKTLRATIVVDGPVPAAGPGLPTDFDGPDPTFVGGSYKVMFQNKDKQTNGDNPDTGCDRLDGGRLRDQHGHWADGYHWYLGFSVTYDGTGWSHTSMVGVYDPSPGAAFSFIEYGSSTVTAVGTDTRIVVDVPSVVETPDALCVGGAHKWDLAAEGADNRKGAYPGGTFANPPGYTYGSGDRIDNVSALSTADQIVVLPVTVPLSLVPGESDLKAIGGFVYFADNTNQQSNGQVVYSGGTVGVTDTLGPGPACPTPTFGGTVPQNSLWQANQNQACHIDDDAVGNTLLSEFRAAGYGFVVDVPSV